MSNLPVYDNHHCRVIKTNNSGSWLFPMPVHDCCQRWFNLVCSKLKIWKIFLPYIHITCSPQVLNRTKWWFETCFHIITATLKKSMLFISVTSKNWILQVCSPQVPVCHACSNLGLEIAWCSKNFKECSPQGSGHYAIMSRDFVNIIKLIWAVMCSPQGPAQ